MALPVLDEKIIMVRANFYPNPFGPICSKSGTLYDLTILKLFLASISHLLVKWGKSNFSPHNFRHWFTTHLLRNGMPREYVKELRGDGRRETVDIYHHIGRDDLRKNISHACRN
ncbi:MAG: tyrosine-type recombinase/integrase [Thaumarchaeota archaeon]|nr:tyrosine-type recombinase/integrase [Nitrososphaerota archaeon]